MKEIKTIEIPEGLKVIVQSMVDKQKVSSNGKLIDITPRLSKIDFFKSLDNEEGIEADYVRWFGTSPEAIKMYPTIKKFKEDSESTYEELGKLTWGDVDLDKNTISITQEVKSKPNKKVSNIDR